MLYLYSLASAKITPVTTNFFNSNAPVFDPEGKYLYFLSDRDYNEVLGILISNSPILKRPGSTWRL